MHSEKKGPSFFYQGLRIPTEDDIIIDRIERQNRMGSVRHSLCNVYEPRPKREWVPGFTISLPFVSDSVMKIALANRAFFFFIGRHRNE